WAIYASRGNSLSAWLPRNTAWALIFVIPAALMAGAGAASALSWLGPLGEHGIRIGRALWRSVLTAALFVLLCCIFWWNIITIKCTDDDPISHSIKQDLHVDLCTNGNIIDSVPEIPRRAIQQLSLWQAWDMFSPFPSR